MRRLLSLRGQALALLLLCAALWGAGCQSGADAPSADASGAGDPSPNEVMPPRPGLGANAALPEPDSASARLFEETMAFAKQHDLHEQPIGAVMQAVGRRFIGTPYVEFPLDQQSEEHLVCRLDGFDCFTFDEAVLAMARAIKAQQYTWDAYARATRAQRYRSGAMNGYCSRLHYYSEWIADNQQRGVVRDITRRLGGRRLPKDFSFMTAHRGSYRQLSTNDSLYQCIQGVEQRLDSTLEVYYLPQDSLRPVYGQLKAGDLVAFATDIEGLDVTHTGLIYKGKSDTTGLLHASLNGGVKISPDLQTYVQGVDAQKGLLVVRPQAAGLPGDTATAQRAGTTGSSAP